MFHSVTRRRNLIAVADRLYAAAVGQARSPNFYRNLGVPDSLDGRFEMIALHVFLVMDRLRLGDKTAREVSQALFDAMFADMDCCLRELGVGDLGVGRKVKQMAEGVNGRAQNYTRALDAEDDAALDAALARNVFGTVDGGDPSHRGAIIAYLRRERVALASAPVEDIAAGCIAFGEAPA